MKYIKKYSLYIAIVASVLLVTNFIEVLITGANDFDGLTMYGKISFGLSISMIVGVVLIYFEKLLK